jgi:signal transduction histidine kinase
MKMFWYKAVYKQTSGIVITRMLQVCTAVFVLTSLFMFPLPLNAATSGDYHDDAEYKTLREAMHHAFNEGDTAKFFPAVKNLQNYLLKKNDLHAYYTQRCNEIVFNLNRQNIFEAYKLATKLSKELTEKKLDKEMYMAINMMGHIHRYCGNTVSAKKCFYEVIDRMNKEGYIESTPPIYMNLVDIYMDENPDSALYLLDAALQLSRDFSPDRTFDIESRRTLAYYSLGDKEKFLEGYKAYQEGVEKGLSSVSGRELDIYYQASIGNFDKAVSMAMEEIDGSERYNMIAEINEKAWRWQEANDALRKAMALKDSINSTILGSSMQGIQDELRLYEAEHRAAKNKQIALSAITLGLLMLILTLGYFAYIKRKHEKQLKRAYSQMVEAAKMKSAFIQNVNHEIRTPLNIISGFAQVIANPDLSQDEEDRKKIAETIMHNTSLITAMIDETLDLAKSEACELTDKMDTAMIDELMRQIVQDFKGKADSSVTKSYESSLPSHFSLYTQRDVLKRIVSLLIDNSVKNTLKGTIILKTMADRKSLTISVEDTGCGVPVSEAERIFERFVKLNDFKEGLGLGLPLCRTLAKQIHGRVWLDTSYAGPGARFCIELLR